MLESRLITNPPILSNRAVEMPIDILLALAPGQTPPDPRSFNVLAACSSVLGRFGWERALKVLNPKVWAPDWSDDRILQLLAGANLGSELARSIRAERFLAFGTDLSHPHFGLQQYEIIHYVGEVLVAGRTPQPMIRFAIGDRWTTLTPGSFTDLLVQSATRLLILQVGSTRENALRLGQQIGESGGPAVLVTSGNEGQQMLRYWTDVYAGIVHNRLLFEIADIADASPDAPQATLFSSPERDASLHFGPYLQLLDLDLRHSSQVLASRISDIKGRIDIGGQLHRKLHRTIDTELSSMSFDANAALNDLSELQALGTQQWHHESEGAIPVSEIADRAKAIKAMVARAESLKADLDEAIARPPRVLNANFAHPPGRNCEPHISLIAEHEYDLLVDIGPRNTATIVSGSADFPEDALPQTGDGSTVRVVVISSDFTPGAAGAEIWVPNSGGRSSPIIQGKRVEEPAAVAIRLRMPKVKDQNALTTARGRLCLYYQNDLLQSAVITVPVSVEPQHVTTPAVIEIDYAISGTLHGVANRYGKRQLQLGSETEQKDYRIAASFILNDDGNGSHRIVISKGINPTPAWTPYDPLGTTQLLDEARDELLTCFFKRDTAGNRSRHPGLDPANNSRTYEQFQLDLFRLAVIGRRIYDTVFSDVRPQHDVGGTELAGIEWERELRRELYETGVIQIARTESAQYTFPFALMYDYPLPSPIQKLHPCRILRDEWGPSGIRRRPPEKACPYSHDTDHQEDVVCPYGFWGLKHVIEQPLSSFDRKKQVPRDAATDISVTGNAPLAAGWTTDRALDARLLNIHLTNLTRIAGIRFADPQPNPAHDVTAVRAVLPAPALVYFLCHGEYDSRKKEAYLGIGARDTNADHCVYPSTIRAWLTTEALPNLVAWGMTRPLVFINGCHTTNLSPSQILNFVTVFADARASGVIGTEVSIQLPVAAEIAEDLFASLARGDKVGQAVYDMRWRLANKGNMLGLAYTLYGMSNLHIVRSN
jgi:hypothetical protein